MVCIMYTAHGVLLVFVRLKLILNNIYSSMFKISSRCMTLNLSCTYNNKRIH